MKYILSRSSRLVLAQAVREGMLCAFDFDGTLAPIVTRPERARMRVRTRKLLARVAALYPCLIVSGRSRRDVLSRMEGSGIRRIVGNHGAETAGGNAPARREVRQWRRTLEPALAPLPGVWIEDKGLSLSLHYRQSPDKKSALRAIRAAIAPLQNAHAFGGKEIVNLAPADARHKGDAVDGERNRLGRPWALFVGDDDNDEAAFALEGNIVSVRVGRKTSSRARYFLRDQPEIDRLLRLLVELKTQA